jgi:hypothetical protein
MQNQLTEVHGLAVEVISVWRLEISGQIHLMEDKTQVIGEVDNAWLQVDGRETRIPSLLVSVT